MSSRYPKFPIPKFCFQVSIDGNEISFQEVTGLDQEVDHLKYRSGVDKDLTTRKRAGLYKSGQVSLKKGVFNGDSDVLDIFQKLFDDKQYRSNTDPIGEFTITLNDEKGEPQMTWEVIDAIPVKLSNADLKSDDNNITIEQIDFVYSRINSKYS